MSEMLLKFILLLVSVYADIMWPEVKEDTR